MADTKISGLTPVTAFAGTQEYVVNDGGTSKKITGTQLIAAVAQGVMVGGYVSVTANQGGIVAEADLTGLTWTGTTVAGRRYRITGYTLPSSTAANDLITLFIADGSNTHLNSAQIALNTTNGTTLTAVAIHVPGAVSQTYKLRMARSSGTGTVTMNASATIPAFLLVEDIGGN